MGFVKNEAFANGIRLAPSKLLEFRDSQSGDVFVGVVVSTTSNSVTISDWKNDQFQIFIQDQNLLDKLKNLNKETKVSILGHKVAGQNVAELIDILQ
jgi:uncharacterized protein YdeI (YjbR/CyaY-like superfamily)